MIRRRSCCAPTVQAFYQNTLSKHFINTYQTSLYKLICRGEVLRSITCYFGFWFRMHEARDQKAHQRQTVWKPYKYWYLICICTVAPRFKNMVPPEGSPLKGPYIAYIALCIDLYSPVTRPYVLDPMLLWTCSDCNRLSGWFISYFRFFGGGFRDGFLTVLNSFSDRIRFIFRSVFESEIVINA